MKKILIFLVCGVLALSLVACGKDKTDPGDTQATGVKLGLGSVQNVSVTDGTRAAVKATVAAVMLDKDGKIAACELDELAFTVALEGGLPQTVANLLSKLEMGDDYRPTAEELRESASLNASWEDQAEAFCDFVEGKTPGEVSGLAATDGKSEQIAGCDLIITDFIRAVDAAAKAAGDTRAATGDDLHLALTAVPAANADPAKPKYELEMAAVTVDEKAVITGCMTDSLQAELSVTEGAFAALSGEMKTKRQMGDGYGMKAASAIKREWYEQARAFDTYALGKTAGELAGLSLNSEGRTDAISGCTMTVSAVLKNAVKAARMDD